MRHEAEEEEELTADDPDFDLRPAVFVASSGLAIYMSYSAERARHADVAVVALALTSLFLLFNYRSRTWGKWLTVQTAGVTFMAVSVLLGRAPARPYGPWAQCLLGVFAAAISLNLTVARFRMPRALHFSSGLSVVLAFLSAGPPEPDISSYLARTEALAGAISTTIQVGLFAWITGCHLRQPNSLGLFAVWSAYLIPSWIGALRASEGEHRSTASIAALYAVLLAAGLSRRQFLRREGTRGDDLFRHGQITDELRREIESLREAERRQVERRCDEILGAINRLRWGRQALPRLPEGMLLARRYRILRQIGSGGMSSVYEAQRLADGCRVAVKMLDGSVDMTSLARLAREAKIASEVSHPNVVAIIDVDAANFFLVMELVNGVSLEHERSRYGDFHWAFPVLHQVALGLAALHEKRIVHRDIKPANVLLRQPDGAAGPIVKIADFGISRLVSGADETATGATLRRVTATGVVLGTPFYLAPEQAEGQSEPIPASDVYSFGLLAYEVLSGQLPFNEAPVLRRLGTAGWSEPPPLASLGIDIGASLSDVVSRCLALEPALRPTAAEVAAVLAGADPVTGDSLVVATQQSSRTAPLPTGGT